MSCPTSSDRLFGPRVNPNCRSFDFTLLFEDVALECLPSALLILLAPSRIVLLLRRPGVFSSQSKLLTSKVVALAVLAVTQLAFLALRTRNTPFQTKASVAADVVNVVATLLCLLLSIVNHQRSVRPSTLLSLYLSASIILGIARVRTAWLIAADGPVSPLLTLAFAFTSLALLLESIESKRGSDRKATTREQSSGFWARTCFTWLASTFYLGHSKVISLNDLPALDPRLGSRSLHQDLLSAWDKYDHRSRHSLLWACQRAYLLSFLSPVIPRLFVTALTFAQPFLIDTTVTFVGQTTPDANYGRGLIGAWALVYLGLAVTNSIYQYQNFRYTTRLRAGLIALVYQQAVHVREVDAGKTTAVALMGTDVERIVHSMTLFHAVWGSLLDVAIASWLLGLQMSLSCLAPIVLVLVFIAITTRVSVASKKAQMRWIEKIQERLRTTTTVLGEMKAVKMLGLTQVMSNTIGRLRADEIETSKSFRKLLVATLFLSLTPINLAPIVTFVIYVVISVFWKTDTLLPAQAFTSLSLIGLLTTPVVVVIQLLPMVVQSVACFDRIQEFCNYGSGFQAGRDQDISGTQVSQASHGDTDVDMTNLPHAHADDSGRLSQRTVISFQGESFGWKQDTPTLHDLNVDIQQGALTVIVGPVGSGKSTFLSAVLGDLVTTSATIHHSVARGHQPGAMAYCSQSTWLENGTIKDNILSVSPLEPKWYDTVKSACGLDTDLEALENGDNTLVGSKGVNLSGGQKQRITLARAVYSRCKVVVLDDVFNGMDAHTAHHVAVRLLGPDGLLRRQRASAIIATHSHEIMSLADTIITIENGKIQEVGSPAALAQSDGYVSNLGLRPSSDSLVPQSLNADTSESPVEEATKADETGHKTNDDPTDLRRKNGEKAVYTYYLRHAGLMAVSLYTAGVVLWTFFTEFPTVWMKWWSEANSANPNQGIGMYLGIYVMLGILGALSASGASWFAMIDVISNTATNLHSDLLQTVMRAPFRLLANTDSGELLNRFSEDMQLIDMDLPFAMVNYTSTAVSVLARVIILAVFSQYLGATIPFLATILYFLQQFYLQTSRQVRLLGIEARAPLYTHFSESVAGAPTIRAFGWQTQYQERNYRHIDTSQRPSYAQNCIQAWLAFVLNILVAVLAIILVGIVVTWHSKFSAGSVGVSLIMIIGFSEVLTRLIQNWTKLESSVGAVARVRRFVLETEAEPTAGKLALPAEWPQAGALSFSNVVASYGRDADPVLKAIKLDVKAGQHIAICGRTGSGKTSLILGLLQMADLREGKIVLDGVDLSTLVQAELRSRINVVSQDPFLVPGTVRFNIDLLGATSDDNGITQALQRVGLWDLVQEQGGLDKDLDATAWSAGQKQLLCLARAMVRRCKVLILDEAMSSVDSKTESLMQDIVDNEFRDCTVLAVMHKLRSVTRYDMVALLGDGKLLEVGEPAALISGDTKFSELYRLSII